jgi:hypothetical protein
VGVTRARRDTSARPPAAARGPVSPAHRVLALQRTAGNRATTALIGRAQLAQRLRDRYGVQAVAAGTKAQQLEELRAGAAGKDHPPADIPAWQAWDPGTSHAVYGDIEAAFDDMARVLGGIPAVREVRFFQSAYEIAGGAVVEKPGIAADFGGGVLSIYEELTHALKRLRTTGDKMDAPDASASRRRIIVHELSHGIAETFSTPTNPGYEQGFFTAWDAAAGNPGERAVSNYAMRNRSEDFAESVMAYVEAPDLLKANSQGRYDFIDSRRSGWATHLRAPAP